MKYFLHDTNSFQDEKITELFIKYGFEGIGLFYTILEKLALQEKPIKTIVLKKQLGVGKKLDKCWSFLESLELIYSNNGETFNNNLLKFSEKYQIKKESSRERVAKFRAKQSDNQEDAENVTHYNDVTKRDCNSPKVKESKVKKSKVNNIEQTGFVETENFGENGKDIEVDLRGVDSTGNKKNNKPRPNVLGSDSDSEVLGVLSETQEPHKSKEVYNAVKKDWLAFYSDNFKEEYYFVSTDGAKIKSLLRKIRRKMVDKSGAEPTGDELIRSTAYYVSECLKTANSFISGNFNLSILDSKFNELFILIKNANGAKQGTIGGNGAANRGNGYNGTGGLTPQQRANALYDK